MTDREAYRARKRANKAAERERLRNKGLRPLEVWARPEHHQAIRDLARELAERSDDAHG